ncbi:MAG: ribonuclease P protein component [Pseudomonadota bacterium]
MGADTYHFPRDARLLNSQQFSRVFKKSRRQRDALFMVCARYDEQPAPRLGLAISKRHARQAVQRNRIKRCAREVFRHEAWQLANADFVVVNQPAAAKASKKALQESLRKQLRALSTKKPRPASKDSA